MPLIDDVTQGLVVSMVRAFCYRLFLTISAEAGLGLAQGMLYMVDSQFRQTSEFEKSPLHRLR